PSGYSASQNGGQNGGAAVAQYTSTPAPTPRATATPRPAASVPAQNAQTAAEGMRERYTAIRGGGRDTVTIMIYMCGTDLESRGSMATKDLVEMTRASWGDNMHVIVYTGGCAKWQNDVISAGTNQIYEVRDGRLLRLEADLGQVSMTKPETLSSFIRWCAERYPANRNELILWDHGGGSVSGYGYDEKFKSSGSMSLAGISRALEDGGVQFDFIGFDACLMATLETGLMLNDYADYMVASEETEPGIGWYYTDWLNALGGNTSLDTVAVGKTITDSFVRTCASSCAGQSATLSVVDLAELAATVPESLSAFSQSISALITNNQYQQVSTARNNSREFARSSAIDQIDLVDFANRVGTAEAAELAADLRGAVKYNRSSSNMTNCYGLSIYFPYRKTSSVSSAISTYNAIGMDESYTQAIREFAGLEVSGQAATYGGYSGSGGSVTSLLEALMGGGASYGGAGSSAASSYGSADMISTLLGAFMGGSGADFFTGRSMSPEDTAAYIEANYFDPGGLVWSANADGETVIALPDEQWDLIEEVDLNVYYDDGEGYIDLGLDNVYDFDDDGNLLAPADRTWLALNGQPVAYYREYTSETETRGYIPALLNGRRVELLVAFDSENPRGAVVGARYVYVDGETETVAKSLEAVEEGDTLEFICDYYTYDGEYSNTYFLGDPMTVSGGLEISNVDVGDGSLLMLFRFTDLDHVLFGQEGKTFCRVHDRQGRIRAGDDRQEGFHAGTVDEENA
ncbi:MAG: peptidase C11, partial [Oscillospiraceae bacterium]|nr:peptidase C11 [Oscillospiraceae bacterium]